MTTSPPIAIQRPQEPTLTLIEYLAGEYYRLMGPAYSTEEARDKLLELRPFIEFVESFLTTNRPVGIRALSSNYALLMKDGEEILICPSEDKIRGTMNPIMGVPINPTPGADSYENINANQGAVMITGVNRQQSRNVVDYRHGSNQLLDKRISTRKIQPLDPDVFRR